MLVDEEGADREHKNGDRRRQVGGRENGLSDTANIEARPDQCEPNASAGQNPSVESASAKTSMPASKLRHKQP
ncbi:hypothetical protein [Mesorhizobium hawassense]|uniref:hypothetical protein n=1 Tax=Mesorhizobium hawassense TaxID=1209954 RepID=UPI00142DF415|nr:hypothetical protein [Mesorhizobium hawassense]